MKQRNHWRSERSLYERWSERVERSDGCWLWKGDVNCNGYGRAMLDRKSRLAHRLSYELHFCQVPAGMAVCHRCDVPLCVNPEHLFLGTHADNVADKVSKGRQSRASHPGVTNGRAVLNEQSVEFIRAHPNMTLKGLAKTVGVSFGQVWRVRNGLAWKSLPSASYSR